MRYLLTCLFCIYAFVLNASEYTITVLGNEINADSWEVKGITDKGEIYGLCDNEIFIADRINGFTFIKVDEYRKNIIGMNIDSELLVSTWPEKCYICNRKCDERYYTRSRYNSSIWVPKQADLGNLNDRGDFIGVTWIDTGLPSPHSLKSYSFVMRKKDNQFNGYEEDSIIHDAIELLGYKNVMFKRINNNGNVVGFLQELNTNKDYAYGLDLFMWNDIQKELTVIPKFSSLYNSQLISFNDSDRIFFTFEERNQSYTGSWDKEGGYHLIKDFHGYKANNSSTILGGVPQTPRGVPAIWKNGQITLLSELLEVEDTYNFPDSSPYYPIKSIEQVIDINNNEEIVGICKVVCGNKIKRKICVLSNKNK